jgi:exopolysaccharide production protein ExoF
MCVILRTELSDIESRRQDYVVAIVQAEARLAEADEANARLSSETTENLANALASVDKEVAVAQEAMVSARTLATVLSRSSGSAAQGVTYEIVRQSKDGARTLQATETSPLMPGDVLKMNPSGTAAAIRPSSVAPLSQPESLIPYVRAANEN